MKIYKTLIFFVDVPDGAIHSCDTIEYQDAFWLVPEWLDNPARGVMRPLRIVRMDVFPHQNLLKDQPENASDHQFVLNQGIPKSIFDGKVQKLGEIVVCIQMPPIEIPIPPKLH